MKEDPEISQAMLQANPHIAVVLFVFTALVLLLLVSFLTLWGATLMRWYHGLPVLIVERRRPRSWGLIDILLVFGAAVLGQSVLIPVWAKLSGANLRQMIDDDSMSLSIMAVGSLSYLLAMLVGIVWLSMRYAATFKHMGLSLRALLPKVGLGLAAAAMALPIVALLSLAVSEGLKADYDHPLITQLQKEGSISAYLLAVFCAVVAAPLVEEFFFRVLIQGWLESVPWSWRSWWWLLGANFNRAQSLMSEPAEPAELSEPAQQAAQLQPPLLSQLNTMQLNTAQLSTEPLNAVQADTAQLSTAQLNTAPISTGQLGTSQPAITSEPPLAPNPYESPSSLALDNVPLSGAEATAVPIIPAAIPPIWPSVVVGILFGLAHFEYGLSFIPLIVLGIVLGLLYRAKHSIWPCFVLHFALNSISMASLGIKLLIDAAR